MPILPLPQFEHDLTEYLREKEDRELYLHLRPPSSIVVRFGAMNMIGEFPYDGQAKPGCGSKIVVRTHRGTELGEMLTSTCENSGCGKSVSRKQMLEYIENSGGADYPFLDSKHNRFGIKGRALRIATKEDIDAQEAIVTESSVLRRRVQHLTTEAGIDVKIVQVERILGGETLTVYVLSEQRFDIGPLLAIAKAEFPGTRVEIKTIGARDEARLTADYERCGQYCCCKNFLKVLKPVSMRSAKVQKATLDPLKISGRCGRLMCCLRYEDKTYTELKKNLPHKKTRVGTPFGDGLVLDSQILTQLVLVRLDEGRQVAVPVEDLGPVGVVKTPERSSPEQGRDEPSQKSTPAKRRRRRRSKPNQSESSAPSKEAAPSVGRRRRRKPKPPETPVSDPQTRETPPGETKPKKRRRRRRSLGGGSPTDPSAPKAEPPKSDQPASQPKRRRRRRRSGGSGGSGGQPGGGQGPDAPSGSNPGPDSPKA
ncbi:MAG TPA: hypothetical protein ENJ00_02695 [Phycisphaerales bacterium]|nr:hypothetical protein [Phycisphaerales bacterium]